MSETQNLGLPLLQASQAQKHVTVNEALAKVDVASQLRILSRALTTPPAAAENGDAYAVPAGAVNEWAAHTGEIAFFSNGGWNFLVPKPGWTAFDVTTGQRLTFTGSGWSTLPVASGDTGASTIAEVIEFEHVLSAGAASTTVASIPAMSIVLGVTGRISEEITGDLSSWRLGVDGSDNRYGSGYGTQAQAFLRGITGTPVTYYSDTPLLLTAENGSFAAGRVRLAIHLLKLGLPS